MLYFKKCWQGVLFQNKKFNFKAYNFVFNTVLNNFEASELYMFYEYLIDIQPKPMKIFDCLNKAREYRENRKQEAEKQKIKEKNIQGYNDFLELLQ